MKTLEDFDRELGRGGEETLEVPARIAEQYGVFPEDASRGTRRSGAEGRSDSATLLNKAPRAELQPARSADAAEFSAWGNRHGKLSPRSLIVFSGLLREGKYGPDQL